MNLWCCTGNDVICIRSGPWLKPAGLIGLIMDVWEEYSGPSFMQQYKISAVSMVENEASGHQIKLHFVEFEALGFCSCQFRPLQKIGSEVEDKIRALV